MERLSEIATEILNELHTERLDYTGEYIPLIDAINKLAEYEVLEEQGLLLRLPCKVGSIVYEIKKDLNQMRRETIKHNGHYYHRNIDVHYIAQVTFEIEDFAELGKTVFRTKEEAEQALARMEKENG